MPEMRDNISEFVAQSVDPIPQALVLTSIVIGLGTLCMLVALAIRLNEKYRTFDTTEISRLKG
jgi:multicomponent Na+:H+ antiporter subunit C